MIGTYFADLGVLGLCLMACVWLVVFNQNEKKKYEDARHRAISSALKDGDRVVLSLNVIGNYPHRVAVGGRVWGLRHGRYVGFPRDQRNERVRECERVERSATHSPVVVGRDRLAGSSITLLSDLT